MSRSIHKLSDIGVKSEKVAGRHSDGGGLYLNVAAKGTKSWVFMWTPEHANLSRTGAKLKKEMGLGGYPAVSLAKARAKAAECRSMVADGKNPIDERDRAPEATFGECAEGYMEAKAADWRNAKHRYQWDQTLRAGCKGFWNKPVSTVTADDVLSALRPIWATKMETASRLRGRIERVLNYAKSHGWRSGENPAAWRGNLENKLSKVKKLTRGHHPALPFAEMPAFMIELRHREALAARAFEFTILTASRSGESRAAKWSEVDFKARVWHLPAVRMKNGAEHDVPLSDQALAILVSLQSTAASEFIFPSSDPTKPLSSMAMLMLLRRMGHDNLTTHGFRSSFRDWCGDATTFQREVAEAALAHKVGNDVEQAYRRGTALEKRRKLMQAWERFCGSSPSAKVIPIRTRQNG